MSRSWVGLGWPVKVLRDSPNPQLGQSPPRSTPVVPRQLINCVSGASLLLVCGEAEQLGPRKVSSLQCPQFLLLFTQLSLNHGFWPHHHN